MAVLHFVQQNPGTYVLETHHFVSLFAGMDFLLEARTVMIITQSAMMAVPLHAKSKVDGIVLLPASPA